MTRTVILGGGLAGLASALLARARGEHVTVLEAGRVGGKSQRLTLAGQTVDSGPAVHSFAGVWRALLRRAGETDPLEHLPWPSLGTHHFAGETLELPVPPGHPLYPHWQRYLGRTRGLEVQGLLLTPPRLRDPAFVRLSADLARVQGPHLHARGWLESLRLPPLLLEAIAIHALNAGLGASHAPALYGMLPGAMLESGLSVPRGGIFELVRVLHRLCLERGVRVFERTPASGVGRRAVQAGGQGFAFDQLVVALDHARFQRLCGRPVEAQPRRSTSGLAVYAALEEPLPLPLSSVLLPDQPRGLEDALLERRAVPDSMIFVNHYPAHGIYPENGQAVLSVLLTAPANAQTLTLAHPWVQGQLGRLEQALGLPLRAILRSSPHLLRDPAHWALGGAFGGAIYGPARALLRAGPFHRPPHRLGRGVWQVGTSAHPGGGIPGVLGSALMVDALIREARGG